MALVISRDRIAFLARSGTRAACNLHHIDSAAAGFCDLPLSDYACSGWRWSLFVVLSHPEPTASSSLAFEYLEVFRAWMLHYPHRYSYSPHLLSEVSPFLLSLAARTSSAMKLLSMHQLLLNPQAPFAETTRPESDTCCPTRLLFSLRMRQDQPQQIWCLIPSPQFCRQIVVNWPWL